MTPKKGTELVPVTNFMALAMPTEELRDMIASNAGGMQVTEFDLTRIKMPTGGSLAWTIPTLNGPQPAASVDGIIVYWAIRRAYWTATFNQGGGGTPPDCVSEDGQTGVGTPGGTCAKCPLAQFGTKVQDDGSYGKGQACRQFIVVFMLDPEHLLPSVVVLPPTSIKPFRAYLMSLMNEVQRPFYGVRTSLKLEQAASGGRIAYSKVKPELIDVLSMDDTKTVRQAAMAFEPLFKRVTIDQADVTGSEAEQSQQ